MQSKKKMIVNTVFLVVIFALTIYGVFHGEDLGAMMEAMRRADVRWLLPEALRQSHLQSHAALSSV